MSRCVAPLAWCRRTLLVLATLSVSAACSDLGPETPQQDELQEAKERWQSLRPARYVYTVERLCFCPEDARGAVRVTVDGETIVSQLYDDGRAVEASAVEWFPSVDGLFEVLREAFDGGAHEVRVSYDPQLGVPVDFWIDYSQNTIDEELGFVVTDAVQPIA